MIQVSPTPIGLEEIRVSDGVKSPTQITKRRGRPRRQAQPSNEVNNLEPLDVDGVDDEANRTWNVGRLIRMHSSNDKSVVSALRKSKRRS